MIEKLLELDRKGIIAPDTYSISDYITFGSGMINYCRGFQLDDETRDRLENENFSIQRRIHLPDCCCRKMEKFFHTTLDWAVVLECSGATQDGTVENIDTEIGGVRGNVPIILVADTIPGTLVHESIGLVRETFIPDDRSTNAFEQAYACYAALFLPHDCFDSRELNACRHSIHQAEAKLHDYIGRRAGYAVIRLLQSEIRKINESSNALECFKSFGQLRHRIMQERLGL